MRPASENLDPPRRRGLLIDRAFVAIGVLLLLGSVAIAVFWSVPAIREATATADWASATAEIVHSELKVETSHSEGRTTKSYTPVVRYLYTVPRGDGTVRLAGDRVDIAAMRTDADSRSIVREHPTGRSCTIRYDPAAPWRSVLRPQGTPWGAWFFPGLMLVLGTMFVVLPGFAIRAKKTIKRPSAEIDRIGMRNFGGCLVIVGGIFVLVPTIFAGFWIVFAGGEAAEAAATAAWIPVEATIEEAAFEPVAGGAIPKVRYRWRRDGREHASTTLTLGTVSPENAARWSEAIFHAVPGAVATIHVDPANPTEAVLVPGDPTREWGFIAAGLGGAALTAAFGIVVILQGHRFRRRAA